MTWLTVSLYARTMNDAVTIASVVTIGFIMALVLSRHFNTLVLPDATMGATGCPPRRFAPTEISVGALIAIAGAPYFIYLVL